MVPALAMLQPRLSVFHGVAHWVENTGWEE
jgi:hypothetical protein